MYLLEELKAQMERGEVAQVILRLEELVKVDFAYRDEAFYLLGNAYRKQSNWQKALNNYRNAIDLNPDSPAAEARKALLEILDFYNKDMYNQ